MRYIPALRMKPRTGARRKCGHGNPEGRISPGAALFGAGILVALALAALFLFGRGETRYNVLLLTLDTTRADRLGLYGGPAENTPHLDRLGRDGVVFDFAIAQAAVTPVSHASILTGLNPYRHGVRVINGKVGYRLSAEHSTLATALKSAGYRTGAFVSAFPVSEYYGFDRGFDVFDAGFGAEEGLAGLDEGGRFEIDMMKTQRRANATTRHALQWLKKTRDPFFLWVHYFDPHDPVLLPPKDVMTRFVKGAKGSGPWKRSVYAAEVNFMDREIGRLLDYLRRTGRYENTMIVVVADHGEGLGNHNWWHHRMLYQEQIHLPLILRLPHGPRGVRIPDLVRSIDIFPTVIESLGLPRPSEVEGKSLLPLVEGEKEPPRMAYADAINLLDNNMPPGLDEINRDCMYCVMNRKWKLIYRQFNPGKSELYDLEKDPRERTNVFDRYPRERNKLMKVLKSTGGMIDKLIEAVPENAEALEKLKALGYGF